MFAGDEVSTKTRARNAIFPGASRLRCPRYNILQLRVQVEPPSFAVAYHGRLLRGFLLEGQPKGSTLKTDTPVVLVWYSLTVARVGSRQTLQQQFITKAGYLLWRDQTLLVDFQTGH